MIDKYDIQKINDLPIEEVAERLGMEVKRHWTLCPFHNDSNPSLYFRVARNKYRCFVCEKYGGPIDLTMKMLNLSFLDAVKWLAETFGVYLYSLNGNAMSAECKALIDRRKAQNAHLTTQRQQPSLSQQQMAQLVAQPILTEEAKHFLFEERQLDERVIRWCGVSSTHTHLLIPYFRFDGKLQSIQWRYLGKDKSKPRFLFPRNCQCHIYNLQILRMLRENESLFVTEGCTDCWAMLSAGHKAIAIPSATLLKKDDWQQVKHEISQNTSLDIGKISLHMYPDNDHPGEHLFLQLRDLFPEIVRHQLPDGCKDFSEYYLKSRYQHLL